MTSQPRKQTMTTHIFPYISRGKDYQTIRFGQVIEIFRKYLEIFFFANHAESETERLVPDLFLFFLKALFEAKASGLHLSSIYFESPRLGHTM